MNTCTEVLTRKWICMICDFVYDEALGIPDSWVCTDCGITKSDFELIEE